MQLLIATGTMRLFKSQWWLFLVVGFLLLAFVMPLGVAFVASAFCAGAMEPKAENNFVVPLRQDHDAPLVDPSEANIGDKASLKQTEVLNVARSMAGLHHAGYLNAINRELEDNEFAAAALGAFDGTVQALGLDLSRFDAAPLIAFTATKETDYGTETDRRIPPRCGAYRADQWADTQTGG